MSRGTSEAFFDVVEWASEQPWSSGKVGLLGISYYAGSQWRVAARKPKGLAAVIPWEGMSDYYRDRCRHGGILSDKFIDFWWYVRTSRPRFDFNPVSFELMLISRRLGIDRSLPTSMADRVVQRETGARTPSMATCRTTCEPKIGKTRLLILRNSSTATRRTTLVKSTI